MTATAKDIQLLVECCICCDYLTDARETPCCSQLFCFSCIQSWLQTAAKNCPRCRSTMLTEQSLLRNKVIERFVDNLQFDCPYKLQGCPAKVPRCDLLVHKESCTFSPEEIDSKRQEKVAQLRARLNDYQADETKITDAMFYDLAKAFHAEHELNDARECLQLIKNKAQMSQVVLLEAEIERDDKNYARSLELYTEALALASSDPQRIEVLLGKGHLCLKKAQYAEAKANFQQARELLPEDDRSQTKAEILNAFGLVAKKCSEYDHAITAYNDALEIVELHSDLWSEIISNLADIHRKKGNYEQARDLYQQSLEQLESVHGQNHPAVAEIMNNLGMLLKKEGRYNEALDCLKQAIKVAKHYYGQEHPSVGIYLTNVGDIHRKQSDFKKAEVSYREALAALEKAFGPNHIEVAEVLNSMGLVLKKRADYSGAEAYYQRAIRIVRDTFGDGQEHYKLGIYYNNLADLDRKRNRFENALKLYQRALTAIEKTLGPEHSEAAEILHNIGQVQHQLGNYPEAIKYIQRALVIIKKEFSSKHYKYGMFLNSLGLVYAMMNEYQVAYKHLKEALQILIASLGAGHIEVCDVHSNLGDVCMKLVAEAKQNKLSANDEQLKLDEARKYYTEAQRIAQGTFGSEHTKTRQFMSLLFIIENYNSF